jgi:hypothetical protein
MQLLHSVVQLPSSSDPRPDFVRYTLYRTISVRAPLCALYEPQDLLSRSASVTLSELLRASQSLSITP